MAKSLKDLPPMPKLRPRPGLKPPNRLVTTDSVSIYPIEIPAPTDADEKTSRLLTKNEFKGGRGGRKRNGDGSLIHSIPKFSQVVPKSGQISNVQKVLQSRLLLRQRAKQQQLQGEVEKVEVEKKSKTLQSMIQNLHHQKMNSQASSFSPSPKSDAPPLKDRRKSRKPDKNDICHVVQEPKQIQLSSEVTISPSGIQTPPPLPRKKKPVQTMLTPDEYEKLGLPSGYVFWPNANIFVHTTAMFTSLLPNLKRQHLPAATATTTR